MRLFRVDSKIKIITGIFEKPKRSFNFKPFRFFMQSWKFLKASLYLYMKSKQFIPSVNDGIFGAFSDYRDLRKLVLNWLKQKNKTNEEFQKVYNKSFNKIIYLTWQGLKNDVSKSSENYTQKLLSFAVLPDIIKIAVYVGNSPDIRYRADIKCIHYFSSKVMVDKIIYEVDICVYEVIQKKKESVFIYAHTLKLK